MAAILCLAFRAEWHWKQFETIFPGAEILCNGGRQKMASSKEVMHSPA